MSAVWLLPKKWTRIFELCVQSNDKEPSVSDWLNGLQGNSATGPTCVTYHVSHEFKTSLASVGLFFRCLPRETHLWNVSQVLATLCGFFPFAIFLVAAATKKI